MMRQTIPFECALFILCLLIIDPLFCKCCNITQFNNGSDTEQMEFRTDFSLIWGIKDYRVVYMINGTYVQTKIHAEVYHGIVNRPLYHTTDVTLIGDVSRGNFSFILHEVSYDKAGLYKLQVTHDTLNSTLKCIALYILGRPTTPILSSHSAPEEGCNMTFTCFSKSTTFPANHGLSLSYGWLVDGQKNPPRNRFSYFNNILRISNSQRSDMDINVTCIANENGGFTSNTSKQLEIIVYYGPTNISFSPANDRYMLTQDTVLSNITCEADCNPACNYIWYKGDRHYVVHVKSPTLSLGQVGYLDAATYVCRAHRSGHIIEKNLTIDVIYGPMDMVPSSGSVFQGDIFSSLSPILCSSRCWECKYAWFGPVGETGSRFSIGTLQKAHDGLYTCAATNTRSSAYMTTHILIKVRYGPDTVMLLPPESSHRVSEGHYYVNIECYSECFPNCTYVWTKKNQGVPITRGKTLSFGNNITRGHAGEYTCTATNPNRTGTPSAATAINIYVIYGPDDVSLQPATQFYTKNEKEQLNNIYCTADCYPSCSFNWMKDGVIYPNSHVLSLGTLDEEDAGNYTCVATNTAKQGKAYKAVSIYVRYGPKIVSFSPAVASPYYMVEGEFQQRITCSSDCFPSCTQSWNTTRSTGAVLTLGYVKRYDTGTYICESSNDATSYRKELSKALYIIVQYPPDTNITIERHTDQIDTITLKCSAEGNPHTYTWQWTHIAPDNLTEVQGYTGIPNGGENLLVLKNTTYMDSGIYKCTVSNNIKTPTVNYESIRITDKPYVIEGQREFYAARQDNISMAVQVFSGPLDLLNITWLKGGNGTKHTIDRVGQKYNAFVTNEVVVVPYYTKHVSQPGYRCQLDIHHIQDEDFTEYNVLISNTEGTVAVKMFVIPQGAPGMPRQLEAVQNSVTTSSVVLTWRSGFHGGADQIQIFYIQMKTVTSPWNNRLNVAGWLKINAAFNATIDNLSPGTHYFFKACAVNNYGRSEFSAVINVTTKTQEGYNQASSSVGASIGGAISGVIAAIIVGVAILFLLRRYKRMPACMVKQGSKEVQMDDTVPRHVEVDAHSTVTEGEKRSANIAKDDSSGLSQYENMSTSGELSMTYEQLAVRNPANTQRIADSTTVQGKEPKMKPEHVYSSLQGGSSDTDKRRSNHVYTNLRGFITTNVTTGSSKQSADADIVVYSNLRLQAD